MAEEEKDPRIELEKTIGRIGSRPEQRVDLEEYLSKLLQKLGGIDAYVEMQVSDFANSKVGSSHRHKVHENISRLMLAVYSKRGKKDPFEDIPTEELEQTIRSLFNVKE